MIEVVLPRQIRMPRLAQGLMMLGAPGTAVPHQPGADREHRAQSGSRARRALVLRAQGRAAQASAQAARAAVPRSSAQGLRTHRRGGETRREIASWPEGQRFATLPSMMAIT